MKIKPKIKLNNTQKEFSRFVVSGFCALATDMAFYYILSNFIDISASKALSFLIGTITAYLMNKYYTFKKKEKNIKEVIKFFSLYIISLIANVTTNKISFAIMPFLFNDNYQMIKLSSFVCATGVSAVINFTGQKFWVFKKVKNS